MNGSGVFQILQDQIPLAELASRYTTLKRSGRGQKGRCPLPNHTDSTPSFYVYSDGRWHCFGCGSHGDVIDLWAAVRGLQPGIEAALDLAREYNIQLPDRDPEAQKKAEERRQKEADLSRQAQACHEHLTRQPHVREWWNRRGFDEELQARFLLGSNRDGTAATIPFWQRGRVQGLIRRQVEREPKYILPESEDFPTGHKPLFIIFSGSQGWHLVEGYVDALALAALGFNAIAIGGTNASESQMDALSRLTGTIYLFPDADESGAKAGREWVQLLYPKAKLCPAEYGEGHKDVADLFAAKGEKAKEIIGKLKARSVDALDLALADGPGGSARDHYRYAKENLLPLLFQLEDEGERNAAIEDSAKALKMKPSELRRLLKDETKNKAEEAAECDDGKDSDPPQPGSERFERATELLKSADLLDRAANDMERLGHVGERNTKKLAFTCALSARAGRAIQPSTHAQSSSGKNALWDTALSLLPPEIVIRRSGLSAKALFRTQVILKGAVLYIQEVAGSEAADYTIRVLQSDGRLEYEATEKAPDGSMRNVVYSTEGPTVIVQTTTRNHLHPENETRVFPIYIDESEEQTKRIIERVLKDATGEGIGINQRETMLQVWHDGIRLLEPCEVVIPYAERIVMPSSVVRIRRDARRLLDVVRVIAWLYQHQRERDEEGRICATEDDFRKALELVSDSLSRAWQTLTPAEQKVLEAIQRLPEEKQQHGFRKRDLRVQGVSDRRLKEILKSLVDTGYLDCDGRPGPQGYTYTVARSLEEINLGITLTAQSPDSTQTTENNKDESGECPSPDSAQSPDGEEGRESYQAPGGNGRNGHRPINPLDFQQIDPIGRTGGEDGEERISKCADCGERFRPVADEQLCPACGATEAVFG